MHLSTSPFTRKTATASTDAPTTFSTHSFVHLTPYSTRISNYATTRCMWKVNAANTTVNSATMVTDMQRLLNSPTTNKSLRAIRKYKLETRFLNRNCVIKMIFLSQLSRYFILFYYMWFIYIWLFLVYLVLMWRFYKRIYWSNLL